MKMTGNTILITGGTSGIGFEMASQLLKRGNIVIITGRDAAKLSETQAKLPGIRTVQSDASDPVAITALYEKVTRDFSDLNILINNAGIMRKVNIQANEYGLKDLTTEIDINLHGPIRMVKQFLPHLKTKTDAAIMNVSSGLAFVPLPISPIYCATKAGLHSFTQSLRVQLKKTTVKVFELAPPATQTALLGKFPSDDMKGVPIMPVEKMVARAIQGMEKDQLEIRPGQSNILKLMSRFAPAFILGQMSKSVDGMLAETTAK